MGTMKPTSSDRISRRDMLTRSAGGLGALALTASGCAPAATPEPTPTAATRGRLLQSVSRWPFNRIPLPEFARAAKGMGLAAIDLLQPEDWPVVRDAGLVCSMGYP